HGRAMSLEGSTPSPSAVWERGSAERASVQGLLALPRSALYAFGDRLTVGYLALNQVMKVRTLLPEPWDRGAPLSVETRFLQETWFLGIIRGSANGRPSGSEPENGGSSPSPRTGGSGARCFTARYANRQS